MNSRCFVGATRTTSRRSVPSAARVRHRMVSLEKPFDAGDWTSKTSGPRPSADLVASHVLRTRATSSGSRWSISGTGRHFTDGTGTRGSGSCGQGGAPGERSGRGR